VFVGARGYQVFDVGYNYDQDGFVAADLTILSDHITKSPVKTLALQERPFPIVWAIRDDGKLVSMSYNRRQDILGWTQHKLGGSFNGGAPVVESLAIIPGSDNSAQQYNSGKRDEIHIIVKRTVDGNTVRTKEVCEWSFDGPLREEYSTEALWRAAMRDEQQDAFYVDSGGTYDTPLDITAATVANPVVLTSASHGVSDGAEIVVSGVNGMEELNFNKYIAVDTATNTIALASINNPVSITGATQANPVVVTAIGHGKSNGDKVAILSVGGMTELNGNVYTVANATTNTFELSGINGTGYTTYTSGGVVYDTIDGSAYTAYTSGGEIRETITTLTGLSYLEGEEISLLADGKILANETVSSGQVTLDESAGKVQYGLPCPWKFESLKLPYGTQSGSGIGKTKEIESLTLCLVDAGRFEVGLVSYNQDVGRQEHTLQQVDFVVDGLETDQAVPLFTGEWHTSIESAVERDVRIYMTGTYPVPFCFTAIAPQMSARET
jgi:hypothetical protein